MSNTTEFEITYLVKDLPLEVLESESKSIKQGFFSQEPNSLRIRQNGSKYELTKKTPVNENDYSKFIESTIILSKEEFDQLWPQVKISSEKTRHYYDYNGYTIEVDVFQKEMKGLILAEVEFSNEDEYKSFTKPTWFSKDLTQERWVAGHNLAGKTYKDIEKLL